MKKLFLVGFLVLGLSSFAFAWNGGMGGGHNGGGMGYNNGMMAQHGMGNGHGMGQGRGYNMPAASVTTVDEAKAKVQGVIDSNYKGYKISKVDSFQAPRGIVYRVYVADSAGNPFLFHVNPWGEVVGPVLNK